MKKTKFLLLFIFLCFACNEKTEKISKKSEPKIKSENISIFNATGNIDSIKIGNEIKKSGFDKSKSKLYFYDSKGRLKKTIEDSTKINEYEYTDFDSIKKFISKDKNQKSVARVEYNKKKYPVKRTDFVGVKKMLIITKKYNSDNQVTRIETNYPESKSKTVIRKKYDSNGKLIKEETQRNQGEIRTKLYKYNSNKNLVVIMDNFINDSNYTEIKNYYNDKHILIKEVIKPIGARKYSIIIQNYDKEGNLKEHLRLNKNQDTIKSWKYDYEYDSNHNWIKKINFYKDSVSSIIKREIKYIKWN